MIAKKDSLRIKQISSKLFEISKEVKILRYLSWDESVRYKFFRSKSLKLPEVEYPPIEFEGLIENLQSLCNTFGDTIYDKWLQTKADDILSSIELLKACGTESFFRKSKEIYGSPSFVLRDGKTSTIDLAKKF